jgi:trans-aconitate 2-methyltransferase
MSVEVKEWYNKFSTNQIKTSVNLRHYNVFNQIVKSGLKRNSKVLEIGCGIGTLTGLMHNFITKGHILAADISDESIKIAKDRIGESARIDFKVTDMTDFEYTHMFDYIILPDVMEHIPVEQHPGLFKVMVKYMHPKSKIIINIPHPKAIEYLQKVSPEKLQIIDQALSADKLINDAYSNQLMLLNYNSYSIFSLENDYAFIIFQLNQDITLHKKTKIQIIVRKQINRIKYYRSLIF